MTPSPVIRRFRPDEVDIVGNDTQIDFAHGLLGPVVSRSSAEIVVMVGGHVSLGDLGWAVATARTPAALR